MKYIWTTGAAMALLISAACSDSTLSPAVGPSAPSTLDLANPSAAATRTYQVTIDNLTSGQPLSPGVVATHSGKVHAFQVGQSASEGIRLIAENGDPGTAVGALGAHAEVFDAVSTGGPIHRVGGPGPSSLTVEVDAAANASFLSVAVMLICTNDGFTGVDALRLPGGFKAAEYLAAGYDAGTEANNEQSDHIVGACGAIGPVAGATDGDNFRVATAGRIAHHPNVQGANALTIADHGWTDPVARITVRRIK